MIIFKHSGNFKRAENFLTGAQKLNIQHILEMYARQGVLVLASATPQDTGLTANSWDYDIKVTKNGYSINWTNSNENEGIPIAILIQYGHGTSAGAFIEGRDFINPAIKPVLDAIAESLWKEISKL